jgi:hypothetical protein
MEEKIKAAAVLIVEERAFATSDVVRRAGIMDVWFTCRG